MWHPFDPPMDPSPNQQPDPAQKERQAQASWKKTSTLLLYVALAVYLFLMYCLPMLNAEKKELGGEEGILQNGVYYVHAGSDFPRTDQVRDSIGLCAYTPGQETEILVSSKDYTLITFPSCWDINSHGLFFADRDTVTLYRMDLKTREITALYALPEAPKGTNPYIFPNGLWEDRIALICYDGNSTYHLVLDCRTGKVLSKEPDDQGKSWNMLAGDRTLTQYQMDYPSGTEYPDWERDVKDGLYYYNDLRENGISVLPQGHQLEESESRVIGDAILVVCHPFEDRSDWTYQLFLADGRILDLPRDTKGTTHRFLAVSGQWLFYSVHISDPTPNVTKVTSELRVMDLNTMETYLISSECDPYHAVTDGNWFYSCRDTTNCYQLEYNAQGIPCGLTLIESNI